MRLFEHPDFEQAILQAAEHYRERGLRPAIIEKDYYVTEALRSLATATSTAVMAAGSGVPMEREFAGSDPPSGAATKIIFKGGTSLSKGWNLIQRFSEDIDVFLDPQAFEPRLGKRGIDRELRRLRDSVAAHPALTFVEAESQTIGGFGRNDRFSYRQRFGGSGEVAGRVLLEAGAASGREPTAVVELNSHIAQFLKHRDVTLGAEDESSFRMRLLHFRRTFVEKLFAIHGKVELLKRDGQPLGAYARHYYDLFQLSAQTEVIQMLHSGEYEEIKADYDRISRAHFSRSYFHPKDMRFAGSDALFPPTGLAASIGAAYEDQCRLLCYGPYPRWAQIRERFETLKELL